MKSGVGKSGLLCRMAVSSVAAMLLLVTSPALLAHRHGPAQSEGAARITPEAPAAAAAATGATATGAIGRAAGCCSDAHVACTATGVSDTALPPGEPAPGGSCPGSGHDCLICIHLALSGPALAGLAPLAASGFASIPEPWLTPDALLRPEALYRSCLSARAPPQV